MWRSVTVWPKRLLDHRAVGALELHAILGRTRQVLGPFQHHFLLSVDGVADRGVAHGPRVFFAHLREGQVEVHRLSGGLGDAHAHQVAGVAEAAPIDNAHATVALDDQVQRGIVGVALDPARPGDDPFGLCGVSLGQLDELAVGADLRPPVVVERQLKEEALPVVARPVALAPDSDADAAAFD